MPNFKIIQDVPDQARIKIFGAENAALITTNGGYLSVTAPTGGLSITAPTNGLLVTASDFGLSVTGPVNGLVVTAPASGLSVTAPTNGLLVTASDFGLSVTGPVNGLVVTAPASGLSVTAPTNGLLVTASDFGLSVTGPVNGLVVTAPVSGLSVTPPTGGLLITSTGLSVVSALATTDVTEAKTGITNTVGTPSNTYQVLGFAEYSFGLVNESTSATDAQATAKLQISPDGVVWFDNSAVTTLDRGTSNALVSSIFLKYARVYYAAVDAASTVDLTIFFQGQTS
ncbi:DUF6385 domain-containing protein [Pelosinus sp. sgz500959]|uniref:DUF6385 domain-containing protein n=1 Tax=Pelosinus sp. sgz500959 TaxID=3242472 RepID=UPI003670FE36